MRKSILLLLLGVWACDGTDPDDLVVIDDFAGRARGLSCEPAALETPAAPTEIRLASDSTWTLLDESQRQVLLLDDRLRTVARTAIPSMGPGAAARPVSVAALGDTAFAVADRGGFRIVLLSRNGTELDAFPLDFIPHSLEATRGGTLVLTGIPFGDRPPRLVMRLRGGSWEPLPVPLRQYDDMMVGALGNTALVEEMPGGALMVVHQFMRPRAFRVDSGGQVQPLVPPIPDDNRAQADFVPRAPVTEDQLPQTLVPAMAMSVDPLRSEVYLLTRSGRERGGRLERAVLRLGDRLQFIDALTLPVHAISMLFLPRRGAFLILDDEDQFHVCARPTPRTGGPAE